ncbi:MAG: 30S ribosomal protein S27ae [Candidatus Aenigmatarchaeota archaeon]|nr:MAG: 30S ribosomal protein S27ae [Candidatus Aenigmarchaeota archaeon]
MVIPKKKPSKSKHKHIQIWKKYKVSGSTVERPVSCPRCGTGTFLAQHKNRSTCGKCGFSETKSK